MKLFGVLVVVLLLLILLYAVFYPKTNAIYEDENGFKVQVVEINKNTIVIQHIEYDEETDEITEITGPQNMSLCDFIDTFNLWKLL